MQKKSNAQTHPEAWEFFAEHARNMTGTNEEQLGKYRIPIPDMSGNFIRTHAIEDLWSQFIDAWYKPSLTSHSVRGQIQAVISKFNG